MAARDGAYCFFFILKVIEEVSCQILELKKRQEENGKLLRLATIDSVW